MRLNELRPEERVRVGVEAEDRTAACLNTHYGFSLQKTNDYADRNMKIDYTQKREDGSLEKFQIKSRMTGGDDILIEVFRPFYGIKDDRTEDGRDVISAYDQYVCLSRDGRQIRVICGDAQRSLTRNVLIEMMKSAQGLEVTAGVKSPTFRSKQFPGVELKVVNDAYNNRPRLIMYVPPTVYKEGIEIKYYRMV